MSVTSMRRRTPLDRERRLAQRLEAALAEGNDGARMVLESMRTTLRDEDRHLARELLVIVELAVDNWVITRFRELESMPPAARNKALVRATLTALLCSGLYFDRATVPPFVPMSWDAMVPPHLDEFVGVNPA